MCKDLHKGKYSRLAICLCFQGPKRHLFPCVCTRVLSVKSIYLRVKWRDSRVLSCMSKPPSPEAPFPKRSFLPPKRRSLETTGPTRAGRGSRVRRLRVGWKNAFFHMLLLSDLCWLVLVHCGSWTSTPKESH